MAGFKALSNKELLKLSLAERTDYFTEMKREVKKLTGENQAKLREKQFKQMSLCMKHSKTC